MNTDLTKEVLAETRGNISKAARLLGVDYHQLRLLQEEIPMTPRRVVEDKPEDIRTLSPNPRLAKWVIAARPIDAGWPEEYDEAIQKGRDRYDAGTHIMCQTVGPHGWVVLYSWPRQRPLKNPMPYFSR